VDYEGNRLILNYKYMYVTLKIAFIIVIYRIIDSLKKKKHRIEDLRFSILGNSMSKQVESNVDTLINK
jgi:hypothetical protein